LLIGLVALLGAIAAGLVVLSLRSVPESLPAAAHAGLALPGGEVTPARENVAPGLGRELAALEHRVTVTAGDTGALHRLASLYQDAHQPGKAAVYYRRYLEHVPADRQAWLDLAAVCAAAADWECALRATDGLLARDSLDPAALFNAGAIRANRGDTAAARRWFARAAGQARDPELAGRAAAALRQLGGQP
jgi:tetratricopeptide (TPR) repeat protein